MFTSARQGSSQDAGRGCMPATVPAAQLCTAMVTSAGQCSSLHPCLHSCCLPASCYGDICAAVLNLTSILVTCSCAAMVTSVWQRVATDVLLHALVAEDGESWRRVADSMRVRVYMRDACRREVSRGSPARALCRLCCKSGNVGISGWAACGLPVCAGWSLNHVPLCLAHTHAPRSPRAARVLGGA